MKILFAAAEVADIHKTGGLGDVVRDLALALKDRKIDTTVVIPMYEHLAVEENMVNQIWQGDIEYGGELRKITLYSKLIPSTDIECLLVHENKIISSSNANDASRFGLFCKTLVILIQLHIIEVDLLHLHDWHMGLLPLIGKYHNLELKCVLTIHNILFQGNTEPKILDDIGIPRNHFESVTWDIQDGDLNCLMQGIIHADYVTTVSPSYREEVLTDKYSGGLNIPLQNKEEKFVGILNAVDDKIWNPDLDTFLNLKFNISNFNEGKFNAKTQLSEYLKKPIKNDDIVIAYVGRADGRQKGIQLILECVNNLGLLINNPKIRLVMLTEGDDWLEREIQNVASSQERMDAFIKFDDPLAHIIYAASDMVLIPSAYEPCGLVQMMAMRYGSVPIARATGGLRDTIIDGKSGFLFDEYSANALFESVNMALDKFKHINDWEMIAHACMNLDWSWKRSAEKYALLYKQILDVN